MTPVGRPREFDVDEALDAAMNAFWDHGYEATSMADLMEAMGLQKGSIYKAFGDKHSLFMQALGLYLDQAAERTRHALESGAPRDAIRSWLECMISGDCRKRRGCFMVNSVVELGPHDEKACVLLKRHAARLEKHLATTLERGQTDGVFRTDRTARELAEVLHVFIAGIAATSRNASMRGRSKRLIDFVMCMLM